jgi:hypothetical protein
VEDEQRQFINSRLWSLALVEEIARADGDPAELLGMIRDTLGVVRPGEEEAGDATREVGRVESAAA